MFKYRSQITNFMTEAKGKLSRNIIILIFEVIITVLTIILMLLFNPDYVIVAIYPLALAYFYLTKHKNIFYSLLLSTVVSTTWVLIARNMYNYNYGSLSIFGITTFPILAWSLGLSALFGIYTTIKRITKTKKFLMSFIILLLIYWPFLIFIETIGYHVLNIHNMEHLAYAGLPLCNCMHAPHWMQAAYFLLGPFYFILASAFDLERR